jgi:predicted DNA binding protein
MADGICVKLAVDVATVCPVAGLSAVEGGEGRESPAIRDVTWTRATDGTVTEEFRVDAAVAADNPEAVPGADPVMEVGSDRVYQFTRDADAACACDIVERLDCPIADVHATDGTLLLTLYLPDIDRLREVVAALDDIAERVSVRYLVRSNADEGDTRDTVVVDRGALTERQSEVLRTAYRLGYFEYRGGANASQVAAALDITDSTFAEHLSKAQSRLLEEVFRTTTDGAAD